MIKTEVKTQNDNKQRERDKPPTNINFCVFSANDDIDHPSVTFGDSKSRFLNAI